MKMDVFFILEKRFLLQISLVSGVKAQHTARKSDSFASSSNDTEPRDNAACYDINTLTTSANKIKHCIHSTRKAATEITDVKLQFLP